MDAFMTTILSAVAYVSSPAQQPTLAAVESLPEIETVDYDKVAGHNQPVPKLLHITIYHLSTIPNDNLASFRDLLNHVHVYLLPLVSARPLFTLVTHLIHCVSTFFIKLYPSYYIPLDKSQAPTP
ncbi:hypothetical protein B0H16DRAFT_1884061 [Mycena metata]|uniref:Uncharacterized protein n=1 Tax=Mycena metata TaxID=1033252 RepID=A0AAD7NIY7_9AGAR|nr:hypothetical protein B0H16DRAFT_1884061 [Mycena metata]